MFDRVLSTRLYRLKQNTEIVKKREISTNLANPGFGMLEYVAGDCCLKFKKYGAPC